MRLDTETFRTAFVREYLRTLQRSDTPSAIVSGFFEYGSYPIIWGATARYGLPPPGGLIIDIWSEDNEEEKASFRFWYGTEKGSRLIRSRAVRFDELDGTAAN